MAGEGAAREPRADRPNVGALLGGVLVACVAVAIPSSHVVQGDRKRLAVPLLPEAQLGDGAPVCPAVSLRRRAVDVRTSSYCAMTRAPHVRTVPQGRHHELFLGGGDDRVRRQVDKELAEALYRPYATPRWKPRAAGRSTPPR
jgi:hypothetical protein